MLPRPRRCDAELRLAGPTSAERRHERERGAAAGELRCATRTLAQATVRVASAGLRHRDWLGAYNITAKTKAG